MWKFVPPAILAFLSLLFLLGARPTPGGVNVNTILVVPAGVCLVLAVMAGLPAWFL